MSIMAGTYTIVVNNDAEIVSVTHNGKLMTKQNLTDEKFKPQNFEKVQESDELIVPSELNIGCVGFGAIRQGPGAACEYRWGTWW
jgi:hypothetical protein